MGHLPPLHSLSTRNHSDGSGHFGKPSNKRESSLLLLADTGTQRETFTDTLSLCHPIESKPGCPLLQPWVSPAGREPALLKAAPELLTTPSSLCLAVKLTALHWECLGRRWQGGQRCREGSKTWLHETGKFTEPMLLILGFFPPIHSTRKIKLVVSCLPILVAPAVLLALPSPKLLVPITELTLLGEIPFFFTVCSFISFARTPSLFLGALKLTQKTELGATYRTKVCYPLSPSASIFPHLFDLNSVGKPSNPSHCNLPAKSWSIHSQGRSVYREGLMT